MAALSAVAGFGCHICAAITADTVDVMQAQMRQAKDAGADIAELRVDHLKAFMPDIDIATLLTDRPLPVIVTCRPTWEGGKYGGSDEDRQQVLVKAMVLGAEFIDVELKVADTFIPAHVEPLRRKSRDNGSTVTRVIVSSHDYEATGTVEELSELVARMQACGADVAKFACTAKDITDTAKVFHILSNAQIPTIALAMGPRGLITRLLAPKFGAFLTFGALAPGAESAPGQPTVTELSRRYRLQSLGPSSRVFGLIGNPVGHSKGPIIHNAAFAECGVDAVYVPFLVDDVRRFLDAFNSADFPGFSVTIPHKLAALECCDEVESLAQRIGAVNTLIRRPDGRLVGYNTDCLAAIEAIEDGLRGMPESSPSVGVSPLSGRVFVVVGAGGAGRALAFGAEQRGASVIVANRSYDRARELAEAVGGTAVKLSPPQGPPSTSSPSDDVAALLQAVREQQSGRQLRPVLANSTSVGMQPDVGATPVPQDILSEFALVFDAVYTPIETRLLREAAAAGAVTVSGLEMFIGQAARQFELFTGKPAPVKLMRNEILKTL